MSAPPALHRAQPRVQGAAGGRRHRQQGRGDAQRTDRFRSKKAPRIYVLNGLLDSFILCGSSNPGPGAGGGEPGEGPPLAAAGPGL